MQEDRAASQADLCPDSMGGLEPAVIGGVNQFVDSLRADRADANVRVTLSMFDLHGNDPVVRPKYKAIPLEEVAPLGPGDYRPRGSTPLNDAVAKTIRGMTRAVKKGHRAMLVILITDGLENSSETSSRDVRKLIHRKEKAGWEFIYLGANQDAWAESQNGLADPGKNLHWQADADGVTARSTSPPTGSRGSATTRRATRRRPMTSGGASRARSGASGDDAGVQRRPAPFRCRSHEPRGARAVGHALRGRE